LARDGQSCNGGEDDLRNDSIDREESPRSFQGGEFGGVLELRAGCELDGGEGEEGEEGATEAGFELVYNIK
jgi:hypothetical protein